MLYNIGACIDAAINGLLELVKLYHLFIKLKSVVIHLNNKLIDLLLLLIELISQTDLDIPHACVHLIKLSIAISILVIHCLLQQLQLLLSFFIFHFKRFYQFTVLHPLFIKGFQHFLHDAPSLGFENKPIKLRLNIV